MTREDIQKLLGGYATDTLTPEEQEALFAAALDDQELFDALAREQALRDLLREPAAKAHLLAALEEADNAIRVPWFRTYTVGLVAVAACAAALMTFVMVRPGPPAPRTAAVAVSANPAKLLAQSEPRLAEQPGPPSVESPSQPAPAVAPQEAKRSARRKVIEIARASPPHAASTPIPAAAAPSPPALPAAPPPAAAITADAVRKTEEVTVEAQPAVVAGSQGAVTGARPAVLAGMAGATGGFIPPQSSQQRSQQGQQGALSSQSVQLPIGSRLLQPELAASLARGGGGGGAGALLMAPSAKVLRKDSDGEFIEADSSNLHAGDTVKLIVTPTADGYLSVMGTAPDSSNFQPVINQRVERFKPFETQPFQQNEPSRLEYMVMFSRAPQPLAEGAKASASLITRAAPLSAAGRAPADAKDAKDRITYANSAGSAATPPAAANAPAALTSPLPLNMAQAPTLKIILIYR